MPRGDAVGLDLLRLDLDLPQLGLERRLVPTQPVEPRGRGLAPFRLLPAARLLLGACAGGHPGRSGRSGAGRTSRADRKRPSSLTPRSLDEKFSFLHSSQDRLVVNIEG